MTAKEVKDLIKCEFAKQCRLREQIEVSERLINELMEKLSELEGE